MAEGKLYLRETMPETKTAEPRHRRAELLAKLCSSLGVVSDQVVPFRA
jgi:hypothetical protein